MAIMQAVGFMFGHGSGNHMARVLGAGDAADARKMAATGFFSAFFVGLGHYDHWPSGGRALGLCPGIYPYHPRPMPWSIWAISCPARRFVIASLVLNNQLRFQGSAFYAMIGITSGAVLNIILTRCSSLPSAWGVAGAALATSLSQVVSFFLLLNGTRLGGNIRIHWRDYTPTLANFREILRGGVPSLGASEPQQPGHRVPQPGLRWLWRRGHCGYEHRYPRDDDDGERHHWLWTGLPAHLRIQLWGRPV